MNWSAQEIDILKNFGSTKKRNDLMGLLPTRTRSSIQNKLYFLNIKRRYTARRMHSEETKRKLKEEVRRRILLGTFKTLFLKGHKINIGRSQSKEQRNKHSKYMQGELNPAKRPEVREKLRLMKVALGDLTPSKRPEMRLINSQKHRAKILQRNIGKK